MTQVQFASRPHGVPLLTSASMETLTQRLRASQQLKTSGSHRTSVELQQLQLLPLLTSNWTRTFKPLPLRGEGHGTQSWTTWKAPSTTTPITPQQREFRQAHTPHGSFSNPSGRQTTTTWTTSESTRETRSPCSTKMQRPEPVPLHSALQVPRSSLQELSHSMWLLASDLPQRP